VRKQEEPGFEVRVNFGVFAGRHATPAEIDELAAALKDSVTSFAIVSEVRHEFAAAVEASVHQVVVEVPPEIAGEEGELLAERVVRTANGWTFECIASRHGAGEL
jgi:hypothetical protein